MSFRNKTDFITPSAEGQDGKVSSKPLAAVSGVYKVNKDRVLRIVGGAADVYIIFGLATADLTAVTPSASNGILVKAGQELIISSSNFEVMKESAALGNVIVTAEKG